MSRQLCSGVSVVIAQVIISAGINVATAWHLPYWLQICLVSAMLLSVLCLVVLEVRARLPHPNTGGARKSVLSRFWLQVALGILFIIPMIRYTPAYGWIVMFVLQTYLCPFGKCDDRSLYWLPQAPALLDGGQPTTINDTVKLYVADAIKDHWKHLDVVSPLPDVSVRLLPMRVEATDLQRMRAVGNSLYALAMISCSGTIGPAAGNTKHTGKKQYVFMNARYLIIPSIEDIKERSFHLMDKSPVNEPPTPKGLNQSRTLWGGYTLLAFSVRQLIQDREHKDVTEIEKIRKYIIAEQRNLGKEDEELASELKTLLDLINKTLDALSPKGEKL